MSIIFPTKADVVAAITNQEVGLVLTVATQLNQMMTDTPNLSYKVPVKAGDVNLFKSAFGRCGGRLCLKDGLLFIQKFIGQKVILLFL